MVDYYNIFHLIDKGNGIESRYVMAKGGSKKHGWTPKLLFRLFNMTFNNAYCIYSVLHEPLYQQDAHVAQRLKPLSIDKALESVCWSLLQKGKDV